MLIIVFWILAGAGAMLAVVAVARRMTGFAAQRPEHYAGTAPEFDIRAVLNGPMVAEGMIFGPTGRVSSRFTARLNGTWEGNRGTLTEDFAYSTGTTQQRAWSLVTGNDGTFTATAPDIVGTAKGVQSGAAVRLTYRIVLPEQAGGHTLNVTDWMYLAENGAILNRSEFRKFGIKVGELFATFRAAA